MQRKLLILLLTLFVTTSVMAQIPVGQIDDFQDGTTQNWTIGGGPPSAKPKNIATGGPGGAGDMFLEYTSTGLDFTPGGKMVILNQTNQWDGDITGVARIKFDAKVSAPLELRIAFQGPGTGFTQICTTVSFPVTSVGVWTPVILNIDPTTDFTILAGPDSVADVLGAVTQIRILHNDVPEWIGDLVAATLQIDNFRADAPLGFSDNKIENTFSISPNPGKDRLNLKMARAINNSSLEVFDVLGKEIYADTINDISKSVDVSQWNTGVYLVRLTSETGTQTKRFIKQ